MTGLEFKLGHTLCCIPSVLSNPTSKVLDREWCQEFVHQVISQNDQFWAVELFRNANLWEGAVQIY